MQFSKSVFFSLFGFGLTIGLLGAAPAMAQPVLTQPITVQAEITDSCTLGTPAGTLDFGSLAVGAASNIEEGAIQVTCNAGAPYSIGAVVGGSDVSDTSREMDGPGGDEIAWTLYQDDSCATVWGDNGSASAYTGTGDGLTDTLDISACINGNVVPSNIAAGTYQDVVTINLDFT